MTKQSITFKRSAAALAVVAGLLAAAAPASAQWPRNDIPAHEARELNATALRGVAQRVLADEQDIGSFDATASTPDQPSSGLTSNEIAIEGLTAKVTVPDIKVNVSLWTEGFPTAATFGGGLSRENFVANGP